MQSPKTIIDVFTNMGSIIESINIQAFILASATLAIIYLFPKVTKAIPSTLVALIVLSIVSTFMALDVPIIGDIPKGLPDVHIDTLLNMDWHHPMVLIIPALTLAALGAIDSLLTSVVADNMTKTQHDSNKELIGQGIGNAFAGIIGGLPGAGATMRTVVNIRSGGQTKLSGIIHSIVLIVVLLDAGAYAKLIPLPVLAGILVSVGIGIIDYKGLKHIKDVPRADAVVMILVLILTVFVDLLQAVGVGLVLASLLFMKQMADLAEVKSTGNTLSNCETVLPDESYIPEDLKKKIYIQHFDGPIFFGFVSHFKTIIQDLPEVKYVILRMEKVPMIDQSGMYAIEDAVLELEQKGIRVIVTGIQKQPKAMLENIELIPELVPYEDIYEDFSNALKTLKKMQQ